MNCGRKPLKVLSYRSHKSTVLMHIAQDEQGYNFTSSHISHRSHSTDREGGMFHDINESSFKGKESFAIAPPKPNSGHSSEYSDTLS